MVEPIKLYKKVTIVYISHVILALSVCMYIALPKLPFSIQSKFDKYLENLEKIGDFIRIKLNELADFIIVILKWGHRETSIYKYNPCTDSLLKRKIVKERMNKLTNWELLISEYNLNMCRRAVEIIGQETQKNVKNIEAQGTEDNGFNLFDIHFSSARHVSIVVLDFQNHKSVECQKLVSSRVMSVPML